ncbi:hypothetical protein [Mariniblastus fucicola]|uniref:Uncharacterized protein n=1 Tax=Mariniblastus fucicola TaxID=980251 RepID=A0A5B9PM36_9BACT|nr:hypothetical protein [Mariniblastus fucicola]QEG23701.1 hypothetical protein MFFC18_36020 [Mariniblastus fucicola]
MNRTCLLAALILAVVNFGPSTQADVIDDFDTGATAVGNINGGNGGWNAKWASGTDQQIST